MPPRAQNQANQGGDDEAADPSFQVSPEMLAQLMAGGGAGAHPALAEAMRRGLAGLVGRSSGYLESLPAPVRARIEHLKGLQAQHDELQEKMEDEIRAIEARYTALMQPLADARRDVVTGATDVPANAGDAAAADAPKGVPDFWLTALRNHPDVEEAITEKDAEVLHFLQNIDVVDVGGDAAADGGGSGKGGGDDESEDGRVGFRLVFTFGDNPHFSNATLTKTYWFADEDEQELHSIEGCSIAWKPGKDVTVKVMKKKPKPGARPGGRPATKTEPSPSFFRWFTDVPEVPDSDGDAADLGEEEMEALQEEVEADYARAEILRDLIVPDAVNWFTGEAAEDESDEGGDSDEDGESEYSEDGGEDEEEEDDSDSDDDDDEGGGGGGGGGGKAAKPGGKAPTDAKENPPECKQQ